MLSYQERKKQSLLSCLRFCLHHVYDKIIHTVSIENDSLYLTSSLLLRLNITEQCQTRYKIIKPHKKKTTATLIKVILQHCIIQTFEKI